MSKIVNPAIVDYQWSITGRVKKTPDFRLSPSSDYQLPIVANNRKFADYRYFRHIARQTTRQADRQADRHTGRQTQGQTDGQTDRQAGRQIDGRIGGQQTWLSHPFQIPRTPTAQRLTTTTSGIFRSCYPEQSISHVIFVFNMWKNYLFVAV